MDTAVLPRAIPLAIAHNVRHMGGYRTRHGRRTGQRLIRSAGLSRLTDAGIQTLVETRVSAVVDLRSSQELANMPSPRFDVHGIRHIHAPVFEHDASPEGLSHELPEFPGYAVVYRSFLQTGRAAYRRLFETIAEAEGAVLFHCAAGKDRTGVAAALLLDLADVDDALIIADYAESWRNLAPMFEEWRPRMQERGMSEERARRLMASEPEDMEATLKHIRETWGGAEGYLADLGLDSATIERVRERVLDEV